jgi:uncharacterized membrane protein YdfJ with MMPL/SSD domain
MKSPRRRANLAGRAGRWSARHPKAAILGWLACVAVATVLGSLVGTKELGDADGMNGDSARAERIIGAAGFPGGSSEVVLVQSSTQIARSASFRRTVQHAADALAATPGVLDVRSPYAPSSAGQISRDGRSVVIGVELRGATAEDYDGVARTLRTVEAVQRAHPGFRIEEAGEATLDKALDETADEDVRRAELLSNPVTLGILLVAFGALLAAVVPVLLALTAFLGATGLLAFASQLLPVDDAAGSVMLLIGLAVGVDYSLFYIKREREERALGRSPHAALEATAATSGRSVLLSGLTVIVAMAGMFLAGNGTFVGIGLGTIVVVAIAVLGSITVLPAVLSQLGDRVELGRIPGMGRARGGGESRLWGALLERVLRRPLVATVVAGGLLVALAMPALGLHTATAGAGDLPQDLAVVRTLDRIEAAFPGTPDPAVVVIRAGDVTRPEIRAAAERLEQRALASGAARRPIDVEVNPAKTVAVVSVPLAGGGPGDARSERSLAAVRRIARDTFEPTGAGTAVGGEIAASRDVDEALQSRMPLVFAFVLGLAFVLLLVSFRSLVIAVTAVALNLLSVAAAYGVLVLVFQHGHGESLFGFQATGAIAAWLPLFLFVVLFGLSMDYHVFILSRIREARDSGLATRDAIAHGIRSSAGVVTAAAAVMVLVFAIFATLSQLSLKQLGVGLATAILIDATLIRGVLLPAVMRLLGEANWYLPRPLRRLPHLLHEPGPLQPSLESNS